MKRVAFLSFDWDYEILSEYYEGMRDSLGSFGDVQLVIFDAFGKKNSFMPVKGSFDLFALCDPSRYDAFIIQGNRAWPPEMRQEMADRIAATGKPLVSINYKLDGAVTVGTDNYAAMFGLVKRVIQDRGCKRPAFVNGLASSWEAWERSRAFGDACASCGIKHMRFFSAAWQMEEGERAAHNILSASGKLPDVVFCCNDDLAVGVQKVFLEHGVRVPQDVLIAGFDNRVIAAQATPRITTVDRGYRAIGALALKTAVERLEGKAVARFVPSEARYIFDESCGYEHEPAASTAEGEEAPEDAVQPQAHGGVEPAVRFSSEGGAPLEVLLDCGQSLGQLHRSDVFVTVNRNYLEGGSFRSFLPYGDVSLLVEDTAANGLVEHEGTSGLVHFEAGEILPPEVSMKGQLYVVHPLRQGMVSIGAVVIEGVSPYLRDGQLYALLSEVSASVERARLRR